MTVSNIGDNTGDDFSGSDSTYIKEAVPDTNNNGQTTRLDVTHWTSSGDDTNALVSITGISSLPAGQTISAASIFLYLSSASGSGNRDITVRRILEAWTDSQVTWNDRVTSTAWTDAGTEGNSSSSSTATGVWSVDDTTGAYKELASGTHSQLLTDVQNFYDSTWSNYGWAFKMDTATTFIERRFLPDSGTDGNRPYLSITHVAAGWAGKINGVTNPAKINGIAVSGISKVNGVA